MGGVQGYVTISENQQAQSGDLKHMAPPISHFPLLYVSSSREDLAYANALQVRSMVTAFSRLGEVHLLVKRGQCELDWPKNVSVFRFRVGRGRLSNWWYSVRALWFYAARRSTYRTIFSRNTLFTLLAGFTTPKPVHAFEFHTFIEGAIPRYVQRMVISRTNLPIAISGGLGAKLQEITSARIMVEHDAHGNSHLYEPKVRPGDPPKIGYFGSINDHKGESILHELIATGSGLWFYVYSRNTDRLPANESLKEYQYLPHELAYRKMSEMDFLILTSTATSSRRDFSNYTSPLKLFEYMSVGGVVIASRKPSIAEIIQHRKNGYLVENSAQDLLKGIRLLQSDPALYSKISRGAIACAANHTWEKRVERIVERITEIRLQK